MFMYIHVWICLYITVYNYTLDQEYRCCTQYRICGTQPSVWPPLSSLVSSSACLQVKHHSVDSTLLANIVLHHWDQDVWSLSQEYRCVQRVLINVIVAIVITAELFYLTGPTKPCEVDERYLIPIFDRLCCCLPYSLREKCRCGKVMLYTIFKLHSILYLYSLKQLYYRSVGG